MPTFKPPRTVTTPMEVLKLFLRGVDTVDIAAHYGIREHEAYKLLRFAMEARIDAIFSWERNRRRFSSTDARVSARDWAAS